MFNIKINKIQYKPKKPFLRFKYKEMSFKVYSLLSILQAFNLGKYVVNSFSTIILFCITMNHFFLGQCEISLFLGIIF